MRKIVGRDLVPLLRLQYQNSPAIYTSINQCGMCWERSIYTCHVQASVRLMQCVWMIFLGPTNFNK